MVLSMVANVLAGEPAMLIDNHDAANRTGRGSIFALPRPPEYHLSYWEDAVWLSISFRVLWMSNSCSQRLQTQHWLWVLRTSGSLQGRAMSLCTSLPEPSHLRILDLGSWPQISGIRAAQYLTISSLWRRYSHCPLLQWPDGIFLFYLPHKTQNHWLTTTLSGARGTGSLV